MNTTKMFVMVAGLLVGLGNNLTSGAAPSPAPQLAAPRPDKTPTSGPASQPAPAKPNTPASFLPAKDALAKVLPEVEFDRIPLEDALGFLRDSCRLNLQVQWNQLADAGIEKTTKVSLHVRNLSCSQALALVLRECNAQLADADSQVRFQVMKGGVVVSTRKELSSLTETRTYDIQPLIASMVAQNRGQSREQVVTQIIDLIKLHVYPLKEERNTPIKANNGQLTIAGPVEKHEAIAALLKLISPAPKNTPPEKPEKALAETVKEVDFQATPLKDALQLLATQQNVNILVNWRALATVDVSPKAPITLRLRNVTLATVIQKTLKLASRTKPIDCYAEDANVLLVSTRTDLDSVFYTRAYDVHSLLPGEARRAKVIEKMVEAITGKIAPETWEAQGGRGMICEANGLLLVTNCQSTHAAVGAMLKQPGQPK